jgi:microcin C transport system ATP-binding protein
MLLDIRNLTVTIHSEKDSTRILDDISFGIGRGETVALVGESGSGKSVTALSILRLLEKIAAVSAEGEIRFDDRNILELDEIELRRLRGNRLAMIFQEPMTSLNPVYSIGTQLLEPLHLHQKLSRQAAEKRAMELLELTGIPEPASRMNSFPHQLSGGQRQRVMIAMALACQPELLIADEPTTALDVTIQAQILSLIKNIQQEMGTAILLITHDLNMVKKIADTVHIMHNGRIVEHGSVHEIFSNPRDPYTIHLLDSVPSGTPSVKADRGPILTLADLQCHFPVKTGFFKKTVGYIKAVDTVTLTVKQGTTFGIVGESGSGKSTLGMCILRLIGSKGRILYKRDDTVLDLKQIRAGDMRPLRKELQIVFQDPFSSLSPRLTVEKIIAEGLEVHKIGTDRKNRRRVVEQTLLEVGLAPEMADRYPHEFSGGQRQRIAIARAIALKPRLLVLDEPTSALDMTIQAQIIDLLLDLQRKHGMTYLFISHDLRVIRAMADAVAVMQNGKIVETGPASEIFAHPRHPYTRTLFNAAFGLETEVRGLK